MKSHEYAEKLKEVAEFLLARPEFETEWSRYCPWMRFYEKENFKDAVRAVGSGTKQFTEQDVQFAVTGLGVGVNFVMAIAKERMCKLVRPAEYECEPFFTPDEEKEAEKKSA